MSDEDFRTIEAELDEVREIDADIHALSPKLKTLLAEQLAYAMASVENTNRELRELAAKRNRQGHTHEPPKKRKAVKHE